jgi:hypothetical protein
MQIRIFANRPAVVAGFSAALAVGAWSAQAAAAVDCSTLPGPVYIYGAATVRPLLSALGTALATNMGSETPVFVSNGSCNAVTDLVGGLAVGGTATYWDQTGTAQVCNLDVQGNLPDIAVSDLFVSTCGVPTLPAGMADFAGPVLPVALAVPAASTRTVISAKAAYFIFGFGAAGQVNPWNDETQMFIGGPNSTAEQLVAAAIGVPTAKWKGTVTLGGSTGLFSALVAATTPEKAIGPLGIDVLDGSTLSGMSSVSNRTLLRPLAFQSTSNSCGVLPDSSAMSVDNANVRNGTYPLWGREHYLTHVDGSGNPVSSGAADILGILTGTGAAPANLDEAAVATKAHLIPQCAMKVTRSAEMGPVSAAAPATTCNCLFDQLTTGSTTCTACMFGGQCTGPATCQHGFCE